jgi:hypothetical protein
MNFRMNGNRDKNRSTGKYDGVLQIQNSICICCRCMEYLVAEGESGVNLNLVHCCYAKGGFSRHLASKCNIHGLDATFDDLEEVHISTGRVPYV